MLAFASGLIGMTVSSLIRTHGSRWMPFVSLVIYAALLGVGAVQFRLALRSIAPDPPD